MQDILTDPEYKPVLASIGKRWLAAVIDYIIFLFLNILLQYPVKYLSVSNLIPDHNNVLRMLVLLGLMVFFLVPWVLIFVGMEALNNGQTIGKALLRIRAVREDGSKLNFGISLVRHLFDFIDYFPTGGIIGVIVASNGKKKQRVGDLVAKTIVVNAGKDR